MKKLLLAQLKSLLEPYTNSIEKAKGKIRLWPILAFFLLLIFGFAKPAHAGFPTFTWRVTDQNGTPLEGALVWVNLKLSTGEWHYVSWCSTSSSGQCSVSLSCAQPCELRGDVEYQGYTGSYSGTYNDGVLIGVVINIPAPSPSPSPIPSPPPPVPSPTPPPSGRVCGLSSGAQDSRPDACPVPICNITDKLTASCATAFSAVDSISFQRWEGDLCEGDYWVEDTWGGTVEINLSETTVPFVGKKGMEDRQKYLADYFEGICPYYTGKLCPRYETAEEIWTGQAETGVWQWLAPDYKQDELKEKMVERAIKSKQGTEPEPIHDYLVTDGTFKHYLSEFKGHFPPKPENYSTYEEWSRAKTAWEKTEWGKLWPYVPMFSREDTQGWVYPYAGLRPGLSPDKEHFYVEPKETKVPHLARLYEVTKAIQELLMSWGWIGQTQVQKESPTLASTERVLGKTTLLAQVKTFHLEAEGIYSAPEVNVTVCFVSDNCDGDVALETNGKHTAGLNGWNLKNGPYCYGPSYTGSPFTVQPGQTISVTYTGYTWNSSCSNRSDTIICVFSVDTQGKFSTNCAGTVTPPAPPPACGLRPPAPVNLCQKPAIMDSNPNDDICCGIIRGELVATDQVKNTEYTECTTDPPLPGDPCLKRVTKTVSRQIGINLLHPYLSEIWEQVAALPDGLFNFFRPNVQTEFPDIDAASRVIYGYVPGSAEPSVGQFYYPYLGGVQKAKEWVVNFMLNPSVQVAF